MDRYRLPSDRFQYIFTVNGVGGRLDDLKSAFANFGELTETKVEGSPDMMVSSVKIHADSSTDSYLDCVLVVSEEDKVEIDVYKKRSWLGTQTRQFRSQLGQITTPMLQTGYRISTSFLDEVVRRAPRLDF